MVNTLMQNDRKNDIIDLSKIAGNRRVLETCRNTVKESPESLIIPGTSIYGYEFESDGCYRKYLLEGSIKNVAAFISSSDKHKLICSFLDYALLNSNGSQLDLCVSIDYREELQGYLAAHLQEFDGTYIFLEQ